MKVSDIKLDAKKSMINNYSKCFFVGILPFVTFALLTFLNYLLLIFLKQTDFESVQYLSPYGEYIPPVIMSLCIIASFVIFCYIRLFNNGYFFLKSVNKKVTFKKVRKLISFRQYMTYIATIILRALLLISWAALYFSPSIAMSVLLIYSYRKENYGFNINLTLFVSTIMLFVIGSFFFFVTIKRYALCSHLILKKKLKNPFKVIENSINIMEGHALGYSFCCFSFTGWILSCVIIMPVVYVLPYIILSRWHYFNALCQPKKVEIAEEKPIIFYINKRKEV